MKKFFEEVLYVINYGIMKFIILGMAFRLKLIAIMDNNLVQQNRCPDTGDDTFEMIQFLLGLILSEKNYLKYSDSLITIYSLSFYTIELAQKLEDDGKLDPGYNEIFEKLSDENEDPFKIVIELSRFLVGM